MKVLIIVDKRDSAIGRLATYIQKANPQHEIRIESFHPKRANAAEMVSVEAGLHWCDLVHFQYWKSAERVRSIYNITKPYILTHCNPYDVTEHSWTDYKINIAVNYTLQRLLKGVVERVALPVDVYFFKYQDDKLFTKDKLQTVIMVAARIEAKKGILPVVQATQALNMRMILVGRPSDQKYLDEILKYDHVEYYENVTDSELRDLYYQSGIHVCNSVDNFESGTMPILEAMACGVPVLSRPVGHVPDFYDGRNLVVRKGKPDDVSDLIQKIDRMRKDYPGMCEMRRIAWNVAKSRNIEIFGRENSRIYYKAVNKNPLVSVVIPTYNRVKTLAKVIKNLALALEEYTEVVIADDGSTDGTQEFVKALDIPKMTIKYVRTDLYRLTPEGYKKTYGLAHARNVGIMEAEGKYIMLLDDRIGVDPGAIRAFRERIKEKTWLWGMKDNAKKGFVENFSFIERQLLLDIGGFPEVISQYGGMTQATRKKAERMGVRFEFVESAKAGALEKSSSKWSRWEDIAKSKTQCYKLGYE